MPRIVVQHYDPEDFYSAGPLAAGIAHAGHDIAAGINQSRALDIAELRAKRELASEANRAAANEARAGEREADRQAVVGELQRQGDQATGVAAREALKKAIASPEGFLGPFGSINTAVLRKSFEDASEQHRRTVADVEQAGRMSPPAAERFLQRRQKERQQEVLNEGYAKEGEALQNALADGKFEDPFLTPNWKPGQPPSESAVKKAQELTDGLKQQLQAGRPPGVAHKEIQQAYDLNAKLTRRYRAWEKADKEAEEMLGQLRTIALSAPQGVDPITGNDMRADMVQRVADAEAEWERTRAMSHRRGKDPADELGGIQKILFGVEASANPEDFLAQQERAARARAVKVPTQEEVVGAAGAMDPEAFAAGGPQGAMPARAPQAPPRTAKAGAKTDTGRRPSDTEVAQGRPAREAERQKRGIPGRTARRGSAPRTTVTADDERGIQAVIRSKGPELRSQGNPTEAIRALQRMVEQELGLDPNSDAVDAAITAAMKQIVTAAKGR